MRAVQIILEDSNASQVSAAYCLREVDFCRFGLLNRFTSVQLNILLSCSVFCLMFCSSWRITKLFGHSDE
jgi:hypothetical protein